MTGTAGVEEHGAQGDLLHARRLPQQLLDNRRTELGSYIFAAQYQQRLASLGGGLVRWSWFKPYRNLPQRQAADCIVQSWDTPSKADEANDYSVCTTWHVRDGNAWLVDVYRHKLEYPELRRSNEYLTEHHSAKLVLVEEAGSGVQLLQDLKSSRQFGTIGMVPRHDKATRLLSVSHLIEAGNIAIPQDAPWLADFQREITVFPNGRYDDQVDSLSQFLVWLTKPKSSSGTVRFKL